MDQSQGEEQKLKLKKAYEEVLNSDLRYSKQLDEIDFTVLTKFMMNNKPIKILQCEVCMFNYMFQDNQSVLIIFSYFPKEDSGSKHISEKTIDVIDLLQETFITLDYIDIISPKGEGYVYIVAIKKI